MKGSQWAPGGVVHITLPYGSKGQFGAESATPTVGTGAAAGAWQTGVTVGNSPPDNYTFTFTESAPGCPSELTGTATFQVTGAQEARHVECSDHLNAPWVAIYKDINFGGQCDAYEGPGNVVLPSGVADTASSINIGANGRFLGNQGASLPIQYGLEIADLRTIGWNDRVEEVQIDGAPGGGVVPGRVCLFNAPTGVFAPGSFIGHMAWAFRIGSTDTWEFGATEGNDANIFDTALTDNHSWSDMGSWDYVKSTFKSGVHYGKGPGYYTRYRCKDEPDSLLPATSAEISKQWTNGFFAPLNDCLTKSVAILQAYGASLPNVGIDPRPNAYFDNLEGFMPSENL
jgi:hypothetical protein